MCEQRLKGGGEEGSHAKIGGSHPKREQQVRAKALGQEPGWLEQSEQVETRERDGQRGDGGQSMCVLEAIFSM